MDPVSTPRPPSTLRRLLLDPAEGRLRTGWRLLLHLLLLIAFSLLLMVPYGLAFFLLDLHLQGADSTLLALSSALVSLPAILLATWTARRFLDRRSFRSLGLQLDRRSALDLLSGVLIAGLAIAAIYLLLRALGYLRLQPPDLPPASYWVMTLILLSMASFQEELLFRGYYLQNLVEGLNRPVAIILTSLVFGALHLSNPGASWAAVAGTALAGGLFAYAWLASGRLWLPAGLHIGWNTFEGLVFGFPVSGLDLPRLLQPAVEGPAWLTGGPFGPEAGLVLLPALALAAALIWLYGAWLQHRP